MAEQELQQHTDNATADLQPEEPMTQAISIANVEEEQTPHEDHPESPYISKFPNWMAYCHPTVSPRIAKRIEAVLLQEIDDLLLNSQAERHQHQLSQAEEQQEQAQALEVMNRTQ